MADFAVQYPGVTKHMYLEGKALEVVALLLEQEAEIQKGQPQSVSLEPEQRDGKGTPPGRDRIYCAREVILETTLGEQLQVTNRSTGNNFIADKTKDKICNLFDTLCPPI